MILDETFGLSPSYKIKGTEKYVRVVISNSDGFKAWLQPYFI